MNDNGKEKDRQKHISRKKHLLEHETAAGRKLLGRQYRRKNKLAIKINPEDAVKPIGKDYKRNAFIKNGKIFTASQGSIIE